MSELSLDFQTNLLNVLQQSLSSLGNIEKSLNRVEGGFSNINKSMSNALNTQEAQNKALQNNSSQLIANSNIVDDINKTGQNILKTNKDQSKSYDDINKTGQKILSSQQDQSKALDDNNIKLTENSNIVSDINKAGEIQNKNLKDTNKNYTDINKTGQKILSSQQDQSKALDDSNKQLDTTIDKYNDINKHSSLYNQNLGIMSGIFKGLNAGFGAIAGGFMALFSTATIVDAINMVGDYQQAFLDLSYRMGQGGKTAGVYTSAMHGITQATGLANKDTMELVKNLAHYRVAAKDVKELGITTARFSEITGVSAGESARLTGELMRTGRIGKESTKSVLYGMATVQRAVGLTEEEMSNLSANIVTNTRLLSNMGKTGAEIEKFAKTTTSLSGAFVKVGLSIEDAQDLLDRFLDPTKFEENALLYAQLGYSLSDVMSGAVPEEELQGRLKELGGQIKGMGMAGVEMAKQLNIPYKQLTQMGELEVQPLGDMGAESKNIDKNLQAMQEQQEGFAKNMEHSVNRMTDRVTSLLDKITPFVTNVTNKFEGFITKLKNSTILIFAILGIGAAVLIKKFKSGMTKASVDTAKSINSDLASTANSFKANMTRASLDTSKVVGSALSMNINKSMSVLDKKRDIKIRVLEEAKQQRREGTDDYKVRAAKVQLFEQKAQMSQLAFTKKMLLNHSEWLYQIQKGSDMTSGLDYKTQQMNKKIKERVDLANRDIKISEYSNKLLTETLKDRQLELKNRLDQFNIGTLNGQQLRSEIAEREKNGSITARQATELKMIANERDKLESKIQKQEIKADKERQSLIRQRDFQIRRMSGAELAAMKENAEIKRKQLDAELKTQKDLRDAQQIGIESLKKAQTTNVNAIKQLQAKKILTASESEELLKQLDLQKKINISIDEANVDIANTEQNLQEINEERQKELKNVLLANKALKDTGKAPAGFGEIMTKLPYKMKDFIMGAASNAGSAIGKIGSNVKNSLSAAAKVVGDAVNPKNIAANLKTIGFKNLLFGGEYKVLAKNGEEQTRQTKGLIKSLGTSALVIGGLTGVMGILNFFLKPLMPILQPVLEAIQNLMKIVAQSLMPLIQNIAAAFLPIMISLINTLMPKLLWVLAKALQILGSLVEVVGNLVKFLIELPDNLKMMFKTLPLFGNKTREEQMAEELKAGKSDREQQEIIRLSKSENEKDKKALEEMYKNQKYADNKAWGVADSISNFGKTLKDAGKQIEGLDIVTGKTKLIDEKAAKEITDAMKLKMEEAAKTSVQQSPITNLEPPPAATPETPQVSKAEGPAIFAATGTGIKKVEEEAPKTEDNAAKAANASVDTSKGVDKLNEGQGVLVNIQELTYQEMKKMNENFNKFFAKTVPTTAGVLGRP